MIGNRGAPLFVQILLLLVLAVLVAQAANVAVVLTAPPPADRAHRIAEIARALSGHGAGHFILSEAAAPPQDNFEDPDERDDSAALAQVLGAQPDTVRVFLRTGAGASAGSAAGGPAPRLALPFAGEPPAFAAALRLRDGRWRVAQEKPAGPLLDWQRRALIWFLATALLVVPLGYWAARRLTAPIRGFAVGAERLGRDPRAPPLALGGPAEIRAAAAAFNEMQERLRRYVEDRTAMVGAIAHDLRTPLTRLAFRLEEAPEALRDKAAGDVAEMEAMIAATLDFVRDTARAPQRVALDLNALVHSAADDLADTGGKARAEPGARIVFHGDAAALRRLVDNLLRNAVAYGGAALARTYQADDAAVIEVDDEGPGLAEAELTRVFEPFRRGEFSRSRDTGGIGLGLAVVRTVAHAHGGEVVLANRKEGGLRARVTLPV